MSNSGWYKIFRRMNDSIIWKEKPFGKGQAWIDLIGLASYCDKSDEGIYIGELITTKADLSNRWGWGGSKVLRFLCYLEDEEMITRISSKQRTIIKIVNYEKYQGSDSDESEEPINTITVQFNQKSAEITDFHTEICQYFGIGEIRNPQQFMKAGSFCMKIHDDGRLKEAQEQFQAFIKYKGATKEKIPSIDTFIGSQHEQYKDGKWCSENWIHKLNRYKENDNLKPKATRDRYFVGKQDYSDSL